MKIVIAGSRCFTGAMGYRHVKEAMRLALQRWELTVKDITEVVSGTARGADQTGEAWAEFYGIPVHRMPADWEKHGKRAGFMRNAEMAIYGDRVVIVWDGVSNGSRDMIEHCQRLMIPHFVFRPYGDDDGTD